MIGSFGGVKTFGSKNTPEETVQSSNCAAMGCRLKGSISAGTNGMSKWYCRSHFGKEHKFDVVITQAINENYWMLEMAEQIANPQNYWRGSKANTPSESMYRAIKGYLTEQGRDDLLPMVYKSKSGADIDEGVHYSVWAYRIHSEFDKAVNKVFNGQV